MYVFIGRVLFCIECFPLPQVKPNEGQCNPLRLLFKEMNFLNFVKHIFFKLVICTPLVNGVMSSLCPPGGKSIIKHHLGHTGRVARGSFPYKVIRSMLTRPRRLRAQSRSISKTVVNGRTSAGVLLRFFHRP